MLFFLPMQVQEAFPHWSTELANLVCATPPLVVLVVSPAFAQRMGSSLPRLFLGTFGALAGSLVALVAAAACMLAPHGGSPSGVIAVLMVSYVVNLCATGPFVALVKRSTDDSILPGVIALSNAVGHLGGFLGPFILGTLHDALPHPPCAPPTPPTAMRRAHEWRGHECVAEWGVGTLVIAVVGLLLTALAGGIAWRWAVLPEQRSSPRLQAAPSPSDVAQQPCQPHSCEDHRPINL